MYWFLLIHYIGSLQLRFQVALLPVSAFQSRCHLAYRQIRTEGNAAFGGKWLPHGACSIICLLINPSTRLAARSISGRFPPAVPFRFPQPVYPDDDSRPRPPALRFR